MYFVASSAHAYISLPLLKTVVSPYCFNELCGYHYENCEHFLLHCTALQETRKNVISLQQPFKESIDETISDFLLFKENSEEIINRNRDDLQKLWQHRLKIIHTNVNQNQAVALNQTLDTDHRHRP